MNQSKRSNTFSYAAGYRDSPKSGTSSGIGSLSGLWKAAFLGLRSKKRMIATMISANMIPMITPATSPPFSPPTSCSIGASSPESVSSSEAPFGEIGVTVVDAAGDGGDGIDSIKVRDWSNDRLVVKLLDSTNWADVGTDSVPAGRPVGAFSEGRRMLANRLAEATNGSVIQNLWLNVLPEVPVIGSEAGSAVGSALLLAMTAAEANGCLFDGAIAAVSLNHVAANKDDRDVSDLVNLAVVLTW
jgi:hypothetical protein